MFVTGRGGVIRTRDPLHPMQVRYQAALRPDWRRILAQLLAAAIPWKDQIAENMPWTKGSL